MVNIGILVFPQVEELDFVAPFEVLSYINKLEPKSTKVFLITSAEEVVHGYNGLRFMADYSIDNCPAIDVLIIPGGQGRKEAMKNNKILNFIKDRYPQLKYLSSVCTGALVVGATGLLKGRSATTYHTALDELAQMDVLVKQAKVVQDGNIITGAGVSSGIDVGLYLLNKLFDERTADQVAKKIEYQWQSFKK